MVGRAGGAGREGSAGGEFLHHGLLEVPCGYSNVSVLGQGMQPS